MKEERRTVMLQEAKPVNVEDLKKLVRTVPDFPKPGILFYDITTLLKDKTGFAQLIDAMAAHYIGRNIDLILGIEARGFIFGPALAYRLNAGFVPVRKPRKLPAPVARVTYELEYGSDTLEIHVDAIAPGQNVVLVDDLLATGGTMEATVNWSSSWAASSPAWASPSSSTSLRAAIAFVSTTSSACCTTTSK